MIKKIALILITGLFVSLPGFAQKERFEIKIIQDSVHLPGIDHVVVLKKMPFKIQVELQDLDGVYLFASFKDSIYKLTDKDPIPGFKELPDMSMAEEQFNPDQELITSDDGWSFWFYDPAMDWHRFDKEVRVIGKQVIAAKSVKQFYLSTEKTLPVSRVTEPLYLFFVSTRENKQQEITGELQRYKIKITWK